MLKSKTIFMNNDRAVRKMEGGSNLDAAFVATNNLSSVTNATGDGGPCFYQLLVR